MEAKALLPCLSCAYPLWAQFCCMGEGNVPQGLHSPPLITNIHPSHVVHTPTNCFCRSYLLPRRRQEVITAQFLETAQSKLLLSETLPNPPRFPSDPPGFETTARRDRHPRFYRQTCVIQICL